MHCSLIMHGFHNGKWLILCSKYYFIRNTHVTHILSLKKKGLPIRNIGIMHQSIPSANIPPPGNPRGFAPIFIPGPRDLCRLDCPGVGPIIKVPSSQLMLHEGTFQLQTDLPSVDAL